MINYYLLMKPGIILGNLVTMMAGFMLAAGEPFSWSLFFVTLIGLAQIMGSGCVFNNYIDRHIDKKMKRTQNRPLAKGVISSSSALLFGALLLLLGNLTLYFMVNLLTVSLADIGFIIYVVFYSLWKGHTIYGTAIGSLAGAIPPVVGYAARANTLDLGALLLFFIMVAWQMAHFYAIALFRLSDFKAAEIPVLPLIKGIFRTKLHMLFYVVAFILLSSLLTFYGYTGYIYLVVAVMSGLLWLALSVRGFTVLNDTLWGHQMFRLSLYLIAALSAAICFDTKYLAQP